MSDMGGIVVGVADVPSPRVGGRGIMGAMVDLQAHDIEVHVIVAADGTGRAVPAREYEDFIRHSRPDFLQDAPLDSGCRYRARFRDEPGIEGSGRTQRTAIDDLYEARKQRQEKAARAAEDPLSGFMRHATALIAGVTKMGWQPDGAPAISPGADGGGEVTLTLRLARCREVHVFAVDEHRL
jgi:hypothetical protein